MNPSNTRVILNYMLTCDVSVGQRIVLFFFFFFFFFSVDMELKIETTYFSCVVSAVGFGWRLIMEWCNMNPPSCWPG
jgi:hypothetical protein